MYYEIPVKNICYYCKKTVNITKCINFECLNYMSSNHSKTKIIDGYKYTYCKKCINKDCCILV